jgi:hypothetical protein
MQLEKKVEPCRPIGMVRSSKGEFLLCYNGTVLMIWRWDDLTSSVEFGLYVDSHGDPSRSTGTVEWEGTAERVAWHPPYILLFDSRFIEIRHVETGRLVQIIFGNDMRCIWDGRGSGRSQAIPEGPWEEVVLQESRVHAAVNAELSGWRAVTNQHVFELVPTVSSQLPGSLASTPIHLRSQEKQDSDIPAWKRLISRTLLPLEVISLIEAIFTNKDEVKAICDLGGDDAQTFINTIHEVRKLTFSSRGII